MTGQLQGEIAAVEEQVLRVERELEDAQRAVASGGSYRGKEGGALDAEEERLARKERLLREKEGQLREERLMRLRSRSYQQRRGSEGDWTHDSGGGGGLSSTAENAFELFIVVSSTRPHTPNFGWSLRRVSQIDAELRAPQNFPSFDCWTDTLGDGFPARCFGSARGPRILCRP